MGHPLLIAGRDGFWGPQRRRRRISRRPVDGLHSAELNTIWSLGTLIPGLSIAVRRLHDTHRSGWWLLLFIFPVIGWIWLLVYFIQDSDENAWQTYDKEPLPATE